MDKTEYSLSIVFAAQLSEAVEYNDGISTDG